VDPVLGEIIRNVAAGGPFAAVFAILWWLERAERKDQQARFEERVDRMTTATNSVATGMELLKQLVSNGRPTP
jgi:hypothetical protein